MLTFARCRNKYFGIAGDLDWGSFFEIKWSLIVGTGFYRSLPQDPSKSWSYQSFLSILMHVELRVSYRPS